MHVCTPRAYTPHLVRRGLYCEIQPVFHRPDGRILFTRIMGEVAVHFFVQSGHLPKSLIRNHTRRDLIKASPKCYRRVWLAKQAGHTPCAKHRPPSMREIDASCSRWFLPPPFRDVGDRGWPLGQGATPLAHFEGDPRGGVAPRPCGACLALDRLGSVAPDPSPWQKEHRTMI